MRKVCKILERAWIAAVFPLLALGSCIGEKEIYPPSGDDATVAFSLMLPASTPSRAMTDGQENEVKTMDILVFSPGGDYVYTARCSGADITTDGGNVRKKTFTVKLRQGEYDLVLLANARTLTNVSFSGKNKQETLNMLIAEIPAGGKWPADGSRPIPMWGDVGRITISEGASLTGANAVAMTRMLARVDVGVTATKFLLKSVHVYNYNTKGYVVPVAAAWDAAGKVAKTPTVVAGARVKGPVNYAADGASVQDIYLFEAANLSGNTAKEPSDRTCLVVGGVYDANANGDFTDDGLPTYYRVDFSTGSGTTEAFKDVLRNHHYTVDITNVTQSGYATADDAFIGGSQLTATVTDWNLATQSVIGDGQWWLTVSRDDLELDYAGGTATLTAETNYNRSDLGFPSGLYVTVEYDDPDNTGWLAVTDTNGTGDGDLKRTLMISATANNNPPRTAKVNISAANFTKVVNVVQDGIYIRILDSNNNEVTSFTFSAKWGETPAAETFTVEWSPRGEAVDISKSTSGGYPFTWTSELSFPAQLAANSGPYQFTVDPAAISQAASANIPYTSDLVFVLGGSDPLTVNFTLTQTVADLVPDRSELYIMDGSVCTATVASTFRWRVKLASDKQSIVADLAPQTGGTDGAYTEDTFTFKLIDNLTDIDISKVLADFGVTFERYVDGVWQPWNGGMEYTFNCASAKPVGESNCYMIDNANPKPILIPISQIGYAIGTSTTPANGFLPSNWLSNSSKLKAQVLWSDVNEFGTANAVVKTAVYIGENNVADGKIIVVPGGGTGNAIIILYEDNDDTDGYKNGGTDRIRWSWHIWKSDYFPYEDGTYPSTNPTASASGTNNIWMDRNLGATSNTANTLQTMGFQYQWGRKDPYPGPASTSVTDGTASWRSVYWNMSSPPSFNTITHNESNNLQAATSTPWLRFYHTVSNNWYTNALANKNDNLWGGGVAGTGADYEIGASPAFLYSENGKSVYDPCPEGYRVPRYPAWGTSGVGWESWLNLGCINNNYGGYYPAAGSRSGSASTVSSVGTNGKYWYATSFSSSNPLVRYLQITNGGIYANSEFNTFGMSVRCVAE